MATPRPRYQLERSPLYPIGASSWYCTLSFESFSEGHRFYTGAVDRIGTCFGGKLQSEGLASGPAFGGRQVAESARAQFGPGDRTGSALFLALEHTSDQGWYVLLQLGEAVR